MSRRVIAKPHSPRLIILHYYLCYIVVIVIININIKTHRSIIDSGVVPSPISMDLYFKYIFPGFIILILINKCKYLLFPEIILFSYLLPLDYYFCVC